MTSKAAKEQGERQEPGKLPRQLW